jgi:hypothetical protein
MKTIWNSQEFLEDVDACRTMITLAEDYDMPAPISLRPILLACCSLFPLSAEEGVRKPLMRDFMGINFHTFQVQDPTLIAQATKLARDYHPYPWDVQDRPGEEPPFPLSREAIHNGRKVDWLDLYGSWRKAGFTSISATIMAIDYTRDKVGLPNGMVDLERYAQAFASFFGPSGTHQSVDAVEIENEPMKFTTGQYVDLFKAMGKGLRAGDSRLTIATCTMSALPPDKWEKPIQSIAGLEDLYDVINMHVYSFKSWSPWPAFERTYPEAPGIRYLEAIDAMIAYRNSRPQMRTKAIWVTEFGYDAASATALEKADPKWVSSTELQQAQWSVRSWLLFAAMDVERAYLYWWNDNDGKSFHGASGILRNNRPKPAFWAARHLQQTLGSYRFSKVMTRQRDGLHVFEFRTDAGEPAWAVWSGTSGKADAVMQMPLVPGKPLRIEAMPLQDGPPATEGVDYSDAGLRMQVGESPRFVFFGK